MEKNKLDRIKEEAEKLGTSYYKYVEPYIVNINECIGKGSFGEVWKGADIRTSELVAVKQISCKTLNKDPEKLMQSLKNEIDIMKKVKHENIVALYDVRKSSNNIYLFMELCNKGSLEDLIKDKKKLSEKNVAEIARQVVQGYKFLHDKGIMHRDLKPANILIKDDIYKIADFGFAKFYEGNQAEQRIHQTLVGSPIYMCPQILNGTTYSTKCDVWSVGVILYELLYGRPPFIVKTLNELIIAINKKQIKYPCSLANKKLENLVKKMLMYEEKDRIAWKDVFEHELLNPKKEDLENTLKNSMQAAEKLLTKNSLCKSRAINHMYFEEHKVINKIQLNNKEEREVQEIAQKSPGLKTQPSAVNIPSSSSSPPQPKKTEDDEQDDLYKSIAKKHKTAEEKRLTIKKITNYFLQKRNKAVFVNHLSLKIYDCYDAGVLKMPLEDAQIVLFVLSKFQCGVIYKNYTRIKEGKLLHCKEFTQEEFQLFLESPLKGKMFENFTNDFKVLKMFLDDLIAKVKDTIKQRRAAKTMNPRLESIAKICNNNLCPKQVMDVVFTENISVLAEAIAEQIKAEGAESREILELGYFTHQALKLIDNQITPDFNLYYEEATKLSEEELKKIILELVRKDKQQISASSPLLK